MPGFAVYVAGKLIDSGVFDMDINADFHTKARQLAFYLRQLYTKYDPDVLVHEEIALQGAGRAIASHVTLLKAVAVILSVPGPDQVVGIYPTSWKKLARPSYVKSDVNDAIEIGWVCIQQAKLIISEDGIKERRKYGKPKRR
jgi:hypothetical protein